MGKFPRVLHFLIKDQVVSEKQVSGREQNILLEVTHKIDKQKTKQNSDPDFVLEF